MEETKLFDASDHGDTEWRQPARRAKMTAFAANCSCSVSGAQTAPTQSVREASGSSDPTGQDVDADRPQKLSGATLGRVEGLPQDYQGHVASWRESRD